MEDEVAGPIDIGYDEFIVPGKTEDDRIAYAEKLRHTTGIFIPSNR